MRKAAPVVVLLGLLAVSAAAAPTVPVVRVGTLYQTHSASTFDPFLPDLARRQGVEVQIIPFRRYAEVQIALATGQIDIGAFGYANIPIMAEQGVRNVQIIAGQSRGGQGITLRTGLTVRTWKDLEGLRLGSAPNSTVENMVKVAMRENGADWSKVRWVAFSTMGPEVLQALKTGAIDGFVGWEPVRAAAAVEGFGTYASLRLEDTPLRNVNGLLGANTAFLTRASDAAIRFLRAYVEATETLVRDPEMWTQLAVSKTGATAEVTRVAIQNSELTYLMYRDAARRLAAAMADFGLTRANHADQVDLYINYTYLMRATGKDKAALGWR
ncbi:MAG: ABC transporter substrate-binding protein [Armatimonadota bacterium]|nr:ABC transporter substrate-binding protein [Armatimonadota bacterium]